ncbi:MAG: hypothetical protein V7754_12280 [Halioglobus sp.]
MERGMRGAWTFPLAVLFVSGCGINQQPTPSMVTHCETPRPQVCTMEYVPVCAYPLAGGTKEYSSGCNACADEAIAVYIPGPCSNYGK